MDIDVRRQHLVQPRDEVDLHVQLPQATNERERALVRVVREGEDDAVDLALLHELEQLVGPPELDAGELVALLERLVIDDADETDAVFGVQQVLACDQLTYVAAADDDRVLHVGRAAPHDTATDGASDGDEQDREGPEEAVFVRSG